MKFAVGLVVCVLVLATDADTLFNYDDIYDPDIGKEEPKNCDFKNITMKVVTSAEIEEFQTSVVKAIDATLASMKVVAEVAKPGMDVSKNPTDATKGVVHLTLKIQEKMEKTYNKGAAIVMRAFTAGISCEDRCLDLGVPEKTPENKAACMTAILNDMATTFRLSKADLEKSGVIKDPTKCNELNNYLADNTDALGAGKCNMFCSTITVHFCMIQQVKSYKETFAKIVEQSKESGESKDATRKGMVETQNIFMSVINLAKESMKGFIGQYGPRAVDTVADVGEAVTGDGDEDVEYRKAEYGGSD